jgi:2-dehydropantoate 2-reductase
VGNEARLTEIFGHERVMGGNARVGVGIAAPGKLAHLSSGHIDFGELDGRESRLAKAIAEIFRPAGIMGELSRDIMLLRWDKLAWNGAFNTVARLTRRRVGALLDDPKACAWCARRLREILDAARAENYPISYQRIDSYLEHSGKNWRELKTSTQQDLERRKRLEYEALAGAVVRAARRHQLEVPAIEAVYALFRLLDGTRAV